MRDTDGNPATAPDLTWTPLRPTPNFPEYVSAHASHSRAVTRALEAFFGTDKILFFLDSRVTQSTRVLAGFHFRNSDQEGSNVGRAVGRYVAEHYFRPVQ